MLILAVIASLSGCSFPDSPFFGGAHGSVEPQPSPTINVFGNIVAVEEPGEQARRFVLDAEVVDCERNQTRFQLTARVLDLPIDESDTRQGFVFSGTGEVPENWTLRTVYSHFEDYAAFCGHQHEQDIRVVTSNVYSTNDSGSAASIEGRPLPLGSRTLVEVAFENVQDRPLAVQMRNLTLVNEEAYRHARMDSATVPPPAQRAHLGRVTECLIEPADHEFRMPANTRHIVALRVDCAEDADGTPPFQTCQSGHTTPGPAGGEGTWVEGGCESREPHYPHVGIWGELSFVDELENRHLREDILQQGYHLGHETALTLDAPARVHSRDEVVLQGTFTTAQGEGVPGGYVSIHLDYPGLENHRFAARYDNVTGKYEFAWDDMLEWRPWRWHEGPHDVLVRAEDAARHDYLPQTARSTIVFE